LLDIDYNRRQLNTLGQAHGFLYGFIRPNGSTIVLQAKKADGEWVVPTKMKEAFSL
jgi:hypothetical protein